MWIPTLCFRVTPQSIPNFVYRFLIFDWVFYNIRNALPIKYIYKFVTSLMDKPLCYLNCHLLRPHPRKKVVDLGKIKFDRFVTNCWQLNLLILLLSNTVDIIKMSNLFSASDFSLLLGTLIRSERIVPKHRLAYNTHTSIFVKDVKNNRNIHVVSC